MRLSLAAALASAALAVATPPEPDGWVVVQKDGSRVTLEGKPEVRSGKLVGRLRGSGTLVSIPEARVDGPATVRANAPGARAPTPVPVSAPAPRPWETPPLGDRVRLTKPADEAQRVLEGARPGGPRPAAEPSAAAPGATPGPKEAPTGSGPVDLMGRGEEYWRERAAGLRAQLQEAERALAQAEADLESAERAYLGRSEAERTTFAVKLIEARDLAARARREHGQSSVRWQSFEEEARKSGAFPGWLR